MTRLKDIYHANFYLRNKVKMGFNRPTVGMNFVSWQHFKSLYSIHPDNFVLLEGDTVLFSIKTTYLKTGTKLFYVINGCEAEDFVGDTLSGECFVINNTVTFTKVLKRDGLTEGNQYFIVQLHRHSITGPIIRNSSTITIEDTSIGGDLVVNFNAVNSTNFVYDGTAIESDKVVIPVSVYSTTKYLYQNSAYIYLPPNYTAQFNTPGTLPDNTDGQFGIFDIYVERANGSLVSLVRVHHPMYQHAYYWFYKTYPSSALTSELEPNGFTFKIIRTSNNVTAQIIINGSGRSVTSGAYALADGDRVKMTHSGTARPAYVYPSGIPLYGFDGVAIPINAYKTITTTDNTQLKTATAKSITTINFGYDQPATTDIKVLVSFDGRGTWKKWNGTSFEDYLVISTGNTISEIVTGLTGLDVQSISSIDFMIAFKTTNASVTPYVRDINVVFNY